MASEWVKPTRKRMDVEVEPPHPAEARIVQKLIPTASASRPLKWKPEILAIGVSTGGPSAVGRVFSELPSNFPIPIVIVQHIPIGFSEALAMQLDQHCPLAVVEGESGAVLSSGKVYLAPGGRHMTVKRNSHGVVISLNDKAPENFCRPAVDVLFRSVVEVYGNRVLGLVMTGMGYDGLKGSKAIVESGGQVIAQDRASCAVGSMPGAVTDNGLASEVAPLANLASVISAYVGLKSRSASS